MRITIGLRAPKAPFPTKGTKFAQLFVTPEVRKKAWDGQDKDAFFRDKYAHVHAKQKRIREAEQQQKREKNLQFKHSGPSTRPDPPKSVPKPDFYQKFTARVANSPKLDFVYGTNAVRAVLPNRGGVKLFANHSNLADIDLEIVRECQRLQIPIELRVPQQHLEIMSHHGVHNKLVLETTKRELNRTQNVTFSAENRTLSFDAEISLPVNRKHPVGLFIDQVTDTHNLGALLRSAQWFHADFVALSSRNCAPYSPAVVKASSGAAEFVPIFEIDKPLRFFENLRQQNWAIVAASPRAEVLRTHDIALTSVPPSELPKLDQPTLLVVGSEGDGIRTSLVQRSTHSTHIPSAQTAIDSLNVSVATGILLSHLQ